MVQFERTVHVYTWLRSDRKCNIDSIAKYSDLIKPTSLTFFRLGAVLNNIPVTRVNQDHLHSVIQFALDRTEPNNTLYNTSPRNKMQYHNTGQFDETYRDASADVKPVRRVFDNVVYMIHEN